MPTESSSSWRRRWPLILLVVVLLIAVGFFYQASGLLAGTNAGQPPLSTGNPIASGAAPAGGPAAPGSEPVVFRGMPSGLTGDGYPYLGQPGAPVTLEEYTDFLCPFCARHATQTVPGLIENYVAAGKVRYVFHDMPLASLHPTSARGHAAARCVAEQSVAAFWAMHEELFKSQGQWSSLPDPTSYLSGVATRVGADLTAYDRCVTSGKMDAPVQQSVAAGQALGFDGTPSFRFTGSDAKSYTLVGAQPPTTFSRWIDALLAGNPPPQQEQPEPQKDELPLWASAEGLEPDRGRPGFNVAGDPYRGNPDADFVVVEFSNFQCPSCREHALEVQPAVDTALVDTGQVMWVFKALPLRSLPQSAVAAAAAECAGDQGRYWDMHHAIFENQQRWSMENPDSVLLELAGELDLNVEVFAACLSSREGIERVMEDMYDAQGVASVTPTFVFLSEGKGTVIRGSKPADRFITTLQGLMRTDSAAVPANPGR